MDIIEEAGNIVQVQSDIENGVLFYYDKNEREKFEQIICQKSAIYQQQAILTNQLAQIVFFEMNTWKEIREKHNIQDKEMIYHKETNTVREKRL